jgi:hypothetical protein
VKNDVMSIDANASGIHVRLTFIAVTQYLGCLDANCKGMHAAWAPANSSVVYRRTAFVAIYVPMLVWIGCGSVTEELASICTCQPKGFHLEPTTTVG